MFFTYLWRELRRRAKQATFIALGLALGVGLVITVTAASSGVNNAQSTVLHSLYGIGTDLTVSTAAPKGSGGPSSFSIAGGLPAAGQSFSRDLLLSASGGLGTLSSALVNRISGLPHVSAAGGVLLLNDLDVSGTIPSARDHPKNTNSTIKSNSFSVLGAGVSGGTLGPLGSSKLVAGRRFSPSDANSDVALVDANYAAQNKLKPGSTVSIGNTSGGSTTFKVIGVVQAPAGAATPSDVDIPLARAQALGSSPKSGGTLKNEVNTIYVAASTATQISAVQAEIGKLVPSATVTTSSDLASEVTGSLSSTATLANNFGKWLAIAVLAAAFLLASLLTMAAVSRRVREFGTLKALGWRSRRIVAQLMGEAITIGIVGGLVGIGLGFGGAELVAKLSPPLQATVGQPIASSATGGRGGHILNSLNHNNVHTVSVHLSAPVTASVILIAVGLAIAGGLLSGSFGGWRAARLRPAAALARLE